MIVSKEQHTVTQIGNIYIPVVNAGTNLISPFSDIFLMITDFLIFFIFLVFLRQGIPVATDGVELAM